MNFMHDGTTESVDSIPHLNDGRLNRISGSVSSGWVRHRTHAVICLNDVAVTIYAYNPTVV